MKVVRIKAYKISQPILINKSMKQKITQFLSISTAAVVCLVSTTVPVFAINGASFGDVANGTSGAAMKNEKMQDLQTQQLARLKDLANKELARRLTALQTVINKINGVKRLTSEQKASLTSQVQQDIASLTALQTKIQADTDLTTLRTDVQSIV